MSNDQSSDMIVQDGLERGVGGGEVVGPVEHLYGNGTRSLSDRRSHPASTGLADAVTVRWFQADLSNSSAAAAVHDEVRYLLA